MMTTGNVQIKIKRIHAAVYFVSRDSNKKRQKEDVSVKKSVATYETTVIFCISFYNKTSLFITQHKAFCNESKREFAPSF